LLLFYQECFMHLTAAVLVIAAGIWAVTRKLDVRLALLITAMVLGVLAGQPAAIVRKFLETFSNERFVVPICTAMGFAYVLKLTECDRHLVYLLLKPLTRIKPLLVPGTIAVGFLVNIPVVSQTSTAVTLGAVAIPILLAARVPALTIGAALLMGSSIGGELLNPGAPELRTVVEECTRAAAAAGLPAPGYTRDVVLRILPLNLLGLAVATTVFVVRSRRVQASANTPEPITPPTDFQLNPIKALIPIVPLVLLFLTAPPLNLVRVPPNWLIEVKSRQLPEAVLTVGSATGMVMIPAALPVGAIAARLQPTEARLTASEMGLFDCRLIGAAMLMGVAAAIVTSRGSLLRTAAAFFDGAGYGFANIISLIVTATCFGEAVRLVGLAAVLGDLIHLAPALLMPIAGTLPLGFGMLCGSGMASTQSLFGFFVQPALNLGIDPYWVGAIVGLASAAGRTASPFAAVTLMCGTLTQTDPLKLSAQVALPLLAAIAVEVAVVMVLLSF
jgi:C4-dicarboxylate transporter, DcuC family